MRVEAETIVSEVMLEKLPILKVESDILIDSLLQFWSAEPFSLTNILPSVRL